MISDVDLKSILDHKLTILELSEMEWMVRELLQHREFDRTPCRWEQDMDGDWQTGCDNMFVLNEGIPTENGMQFCPYCGHRVEEMV